MKLKFMHIVDKYVGIPICFLLSILNVFIPKKKSDRNNFLFIELPEMGSALLSYDAITSLKKAYPNSKFFFMIFKQNKDSLVITNLIEYDNIISIRSDSFVNFSADIIKAWIKLYKSNIDVVIDMEIFSRFSSIFSFIICAKERIGFYLYNAYGLYRGNLLTHKVSYNYYSHISKNYMALIKALDLPGYSNEPIIKDLINYKPNKISIEKNNFIIENLKSKLKIEYPKFNISNKIVLISAYAGDLPIRAWSPNYYIELSKKILNNFENALIVITGTTSATKLHDKIYNEIDNKRCINLSGKTDLNEFIQLCHISSIIITSDGGAAHFASTTDINGLVFFGPETPFIYKPISDNIEAIYLNYNCSPCLNAFNFRITSCNDNLCLKNISVEFVYNKFLMLYSCEKH